MSPRERFLGLDIGTRRIGVALSDEMGWTGIPLTTVEVHRNGAHVREIARLCKQHGITTLVAGLPLNMDGTEGRMVRKVRDVLTTLGEATGLPVVEWDERLTSMAVDRVLDEASMNPRDRRDVIDKLSASLILQGFLERRRNMAP